MANGKTTGKTALALKRRLNAFVNAPAWRAEIDRKNARIEELEKSASEGERENSRLRGRLLAGERNPALISPDRLVWCFGYGRTGSSWLNGMLQRPEGHFQWGEPLVGKLFADLYYGPAGVSNRENLHFILGEPVKEVWLKSIRSFVLEGASARFPEAVEGGYVMANEPNGSLGAPLIMSALPESRMILLVRDPRDVVASFLDANRSGGWLSDQRGEFELLADSDPNLFVEQRSGWFMESMKKARRAYEDHPGEKTLVRYEDLRNETMDVMRGLYSDLDIQVQESELEGSVKRFDWENMKSVDKGPGKFHRKAKPGGWREDLTREQAEIVERVSAPFIDEFYPGSR